MSDCARITWTKKQGDLISAGKAVPLGILLWDSERDEITLLPCQGQHVEEVRAMITAYVRPFDDKVSTPLGSDTKAGNGETGE